MSTSTTTEIPWAAVAPLLLVALAFVGYRAAAVSIVATVALLAGAVRLLDRREI